MALIQAGQPTSGWPSLNSEVQDTRKRQTDLCTFQCLWSVVGEVGRVDQLDLWRVDLVSVRCDSAEELCVHSEAIRNSSPA